MIVLKIKKNKRKRSTIEVNKAKTKVKVLITIKQLDKVPLFSSRTRAPCRFIRLDPDRPYTIGRDPTLSQFVFNDPRVSKRHCQILFDRSLHKVYLLHGSFSFSGNRSSSTSTVYSSIVQEFRNRLLHCDEMFQETSVGTFRASLNRLFINGIEISKGSVVELFGGDEVMLVGLNKHALCDSHIRIGLVIERIAFLERVVFGCDENGNTLDKPNVFSPSSSGKIKKRIVALKTDELGSIRPKHDDIVERARTLLVYCRSILHSDDPIYFIRSHTFPQFHADDTYESSSICDLQVLKPSNNSEKFTVSGELQTNSDARVFEKRNTSQTNQSIDVVKEAVLENLKATGENLCSQGFAAVVTKNDTENTNPNILLNSQSKSNPSDFVVPPPGKSFYLNRLGGMRSSIDQHNAVSLPELLYPLKSISRIFIATFTSDILWFLSYCVIPCNLPITIACHNTEKCWSADSENRFSVPYPNFPNLIVVHPEFPESIAFGKDRKRQGIACHHPKLFVLQREDSIRVIITSANLVETQWNHVTNTIWWQDFPRTNSHDYLSLFPQMGLEKNFKNDFAAHLAGFIAYLVIDIPSQAHWIIELTKYDFGGAMGYLIASVPGIHSHRALSTIEPIQFLSGDHHKSCTGGKFLGSVEASVVGLNHLFQTADKSGAQLRKLAVFLRKSCERAHGVLEVVLKRNKNLPADANAVSIFVRNPKKISEGDWVQLGFLPRNVAKWVSPLWDVGFVKFLGFVYPKEALGAASGENDMKVHLILQVSQGPNFGNMSKVMNIEHVAALSSLIASIQRCTGLWRLEQILDQYKWPEPLESDFLYGASSIGANAQFLAAFSTAAGKRSLQSFDSEESDPEWGCWNANEELKNPSIRIIFPTIARVKNACSGILPSKRILCFSEKTWERLKPVDILHDAIPHPFERVGHPMHVKVARRRFESKEDASSFGWVYCGSHNLSAAAWGRQISIESGNSHSSTRLRVCNYELGIVFVFPPSKTIKGINGKSIIPNLDDVILPFVVPAPKYGPRDRPATKQAMRKTMDAFLQDNKECKADLCTDFIEDTIEEMSDEDEVIEIDNYLAGDKDEDNVYANVLWTQVDST